MIKAFSREGTIIRFTANNIIKQDMGCKEKYKYMTEVFDRMDLCNVIKLKSFMMEVDNIIRKRTMKGGC